MYRLCALRKREDAKASAPPPCRCRSTSCASSRLHALSSHRSECAPACLYDEGHALVTMDLRIRCGHSVPSAPASA